MTGCTKLNTHFQRASETIKIMMRMKDDGYYITTDGLQDYWYSYEII